MCKLINKALTHTQVWFLRHGKTPFDYENSEYDDFIEMLCNGYNTRLSKDHGLDLSIFPKKVDFVGYSPFIRAYETAKLLTENIIVGEFDELEFLSEVKFSRDILKRSEFDSLANNRKDILERWYNGRNMAETVRDSFKRVREVENFLLHKNYQTVILVTHGWFLRLLELYFVHGKRFYDEVSLEDVLNIRPIKLGESIKANIARRQISEFARELVEFPL